MVEEAAHETNGEQGGREQAFFLCDMLALLISFYANGISAAKASNVVANCAKKARRRSPNPTPFVSHIGNERGCKLADAYFVAVAAFLTRLNTLSC